VLKWICLHTKFVHAEIWNVGPADHPSGNGVTGPNDLAGDDRESVAASSVRDRSHHSLARESSERSVEMSIDEEFERALSADGHPHLRSEDGNVHDGESHAQNSRGPMMHLFHHKAKGAHHCCFSGVSFTKPSSSHAWTRHAPCGLSESETVLVELERVRREASFRCGQSLPGSIWLQGHQDWNIFNQMMEDPETPKDPLTELSGKLFLAYLGLPIFDAANTKRIVGVLMLYLPHEPTSGERTHNEEIAHVARSYLDVKHNPDVIKCMKHSAGMISHMRAYFQRRDRFNYYAYKIARAKTDKPVGGISVLEEEETFTNLSAEPSALEEKQKIRSFFSEYWRKWKGAEGKPPPRMDVKGMAVTFVGAFIGLLAVSYSAWACGPVGNETYYAIMLGSYGALATLIFAAPSSPFAQPRMVIGSHIIACSIAVIVNYLTDPKYVAFFPQPVSDALVPALVITAMAGSGLTHPPAAACSIIYISAGPQIRELGWAYLIPSLLGCVILVFTALIVNNLAPFRSYPLFW